MTASGAPRPGCSTPLEPAALMDYWLGVLSPSEEEAVETHLLACDACGDWLRRAIALSEGLRGLSRSGVLRVIVNDGLVRQAVAAGFRVREYSASPGDVVQCTVSADDDFLVARLGADLRGASRVDLSFSMPGRGEIERLADVPIDAVAGSVVYSESIAFAKASPDNTMMMRLLAVDGDGAERLLGEYTFHHTRTIPGAPGW